jgi:hypothetical protein
LASWTENDHRKAVKTESLKRTSHKECLKMCWKLTFDEENKTDENNAWEKEG